MSEKSEMTDNRRARTLDTAKDLVNGQRAQDYGPPEVNFGRIADLWKPIFGPDVTPAKVALALTQLKIARLIQSIDHEDSWVDAAGYIALGSELSLGNPTAALPTERHIFRAGDVVAVPEANNSYRTYRLVEARCYKGVTGWDAIDEEDAEMEFLQDGSYYAKEVQ